MNNSDYKLIQTATGLQLEAIKFTHFKPLLIDFINSAARQKKGQSIYSEHIVRACGIKPTYLPYIIDATAGLGQDAYVLARTGCKVLMIERSPYLAALLADALSRLKHVSSHIDLTLLHDSAIHFLTELQAQPTPEQHYPDIIYLDPMFKPRHKTALVKKEMRLLRDLVGEDDDADELLQIALKCAKKRVVVKRHRKAEPLGQQIADFAIEGKVSRFDVYCIT